MRIGIPRALHFLQYYPLWRTFFEELGAEIVISPPTNRDMVAVGAKMVADVTCLPIKVYAGHVDWLRAHGRVDYVFVPAIRSVEWGALHCSKFQALPDLIRATVVDCPPLLEIGIDVHRYKISPTQAFQQLGKQFTWNPLKIQSAWKRACRADGIYRALMTTEKTTYLDALARLYPKDFTTTTATVQSHLNIAVVGHPYCLHDDYINHNVVTRLRNLGARVFTSEMVAPDEAKIGIEQTTGQKRWFFEDWMSGAAGHYLHESNVAGLIALMAFSCGPDSAMVETMTRRAHALQRPFMTLVLDEHGSAAGMITRLEAFVDMLTRQKTQSIALPIQPEKKIQAPVVLREIHKPVIGFPRMGTSAIAIKSMFEGIGAKVELGPKLSSRTVSLGVRHSPEFICTPYKYILGNMIEMLDSGADTLLYMDGAELCRNSSYTQLLNDVLTDLGYKFRLVSTAVFEKGGVFALPQFLRPFMEQFSWSTVLREIRLALAKMTALDEMERKLQAVRAREVTRGSVDKVWEEGQLRIDQIREVEAIQPIQIDVLKKMDQVLIDPTHQPVRIATTGEYYAVLEPFYNLDVERILGQLGAEVRRTLMLADWAKLNLILEAIGFHKSEVDQAAKPYLRWNIGGEGLMTVGQTVLSAKKGIDGMVELLPFTCIPEVTALNILPRISREFNLPIISFILDEQSGQAGMRTRLEAFVDKSVKLFGIRRVE